MIDKRLQPTVITYTLLSGYCNGRKLHKAFRVYHEMTGKGIAPNTYTFTALISGLCRENMMAEAIKLFDEMVERKIIPNC